MTISLRAGGTERVISTIANHLCRRHEVSILVLAGQAPFYRLDPRVRLRHPVDPPTRKMWWRYYFHMFRHIRSHVVHLRPDVVMSFGETINPFVLLSTLFIECHKLVFNRASPLSSLQGSRGRLNRLIYPLATTVYVQTAEARRLLEGRYPLTNFAVISNPVDIPDDVPKLPTRSKVILNVGYLGGRKNQAALIRAFSECVGREGWTLAIVGTGPDLAALRQLVEREGLEESVRFLGERTDVTELLLDAQIFAFTSLSEGFPNALAEALAAGCASISFDCRTGPSELISDGRNGLLIELGNEEAFRRGLERLMGQQALRERLSEQARTDIRPFESSTVLAEFDALVDIARRADS